MNEYHPPITGLESQFEDELGNHPEIEAHQAGSTSSDSAPSSPVTGPGADTEEAMHLAR